MILSRFIEEGVVCFLDAHSRDEALEQLVEALANAGELADKKDFYDAILKREKIVSTGIGMGVAIPHAKLPSLSRFFLAIGIQKNQEGIEWDALDGAPVRLIFLIGGPADAQTEYLKILSSLTTAIKDEDLRGEILTADAKEDLVSLFEKKE